MKIRAGAEGHLKELIWLENFLLQSLDLEGLEAEIFTVLSGLSTTNVSFGDLQQVDEVVKKFYSTRIDPALGVIVRAFVLGTLIERSEARGLRPLIDVGKLPQTVQQAAIEGKLTAKETKALEFAITRGAKHLSDAQSGTIKTVQEAVFNNISNHGTYSDLKKQLQATFADDDSEFNRDWHRVAINEVNSAFNNGYISLVPGKFVMWKALPGCCAYCGSMDGKVFMVVEPRTSLGYGDLDKSSPEYRDRAWLWDNTVWAGKDNYGRSRHENKMTDEGKEKREHHEKYTPCLPAHVSCRCHWIRIEPSGVFVKDKKIEFRSKNENEWLKWNNREITPKLQGVDRLARLVQ